MNNEMMVSAVDSTPEELHRSDESILFALYCVFIFVWFKFKKADRLLVFYNYILSIVTIAIISFFFI